MLLNYNKQNWTYLMTIVKGLSTIYFVQHNQIIQSLDIGLLNANIGLYFYIKFFPYLQKKYILFLLLYLIYLQIL